MKVEEIIHEVTHSIAPDGASIVWRTCPERQADVLVMSFNQIRGRDGKMLVAHIYEQGILSLGRDMPHVVGDHLFKFLHAALLVSRELQVVLSGGNENLREETLEDHLKMIVRLREIAQRLNIEYEEPPDPRTE